MSTKKVFDNEHLLYGCDGLIKNILLLVYCKNKWMLLFSMGKSVAKQYN